LQTAGPDLCPISPTTARRARSGPTREDVALDLGAQVLLCCGISLRRRTNPLDDRRGSRARGRRHTRRPATPFPGRLLFFRDRVRPPLWSLTRRSPGVRLPGLSPSFRSLSRARCGPMPSAFPCGICFERELRPRRSHGCSATR